MSDIQKEWTHTGVQFTDIRKLNKLYLISTKDHSPLFVNEGIFESRLKSFFLKEAYKVTREEILSVDWNLYLSKGYYIKIDREGNLSKYDMNPDKTYVSFLEIKGPLGTFQSVHQEDKVEINN
jgi:hypothetical protein